ncbi:MAG: antitoxin VapB family protein [Methanophagales archaeon]|nr:antitoxin VapB family protein [Methanophagales archaeon]
MSTRTLSISEEVYARLNAERREGENFNDVLIRLTEKKSLMNIAGFLKERDAEEMWKVIKEMREKSRDRTLRYISLHEYSWVECEKCSKSRRSAG